MNRRLKFLAVLWGLALVAIAPFFVSPSWKQVSNDSESLITLTNLDESEGEKFFSENILPVLNDSCISCHGEEKQESGLRLDSRDAVLKGGGRGEIIDKDDAGASLLISALKFREECELQMPPDGKLDDDVVDAFEKWIEMGTPWSKE